jgi:hypothetical protein
MWRAGSISGTILEPDGRPIVAVQVQVLQRVADTWVTGGFSTTSDDRGSYRLPNLAAGTYAVVVRPSARMSLPHPVFFPNSPTVGGALSVEVQSGTDTAGVDFRVDLSLARDGKRVAGMLTGDPGTIENLDVGLAPADEPSIEQNIRTVKTDGAGRFAFTGVAPGPYRVQMFRMGTTADLSGTAAPRPVRPSLAARADVTVADRDVDNLAVPVVVAGRIRGRLAFDGAAPPTAGELLRSYVLPAPADGQSVGPLQVSPVGPDGQFETPGLPPGRYNIGLVGLSQWGRVSTVVGSTDFSGRPLELGTTDLTNLILTYTDKPTGVVGRVRNPQGQPVSARLYLIPRDRRRQTSSIPGSRAQGNASGSFEFQWVVPGDYLVAALVGDPPDDWTAPAFLRSLESVATPVHVTAGETTTVDLRPVIPR